MDIATVDRALRQYGLEPVEMLQAQAGYRNEIYPVRLQDGAIVSLILYKREPAIVQTIRNANLAGAFLTKQGFHTRYAADDRILRLKARGIQRYAAVYNYLPV